MIRDFLAKLVPAGLMVIGVKRNSRFNNIVCRDLDDVDAVVARTSLDKAADIYFGLGVLAAREFMCADGKTRVRVQDNIKGLKSFWVDIDVDPAESDKYSCADDAEDAVWDFVDDYDMPDPMIVFSGGGLHVYWPLTKAVSKDAWLPLAQALKAGLIAAGVRIDRTRTADASSVLRLPGTLNTKYGTTVEIIHDSDAISPSTMKAAILGLPGSTAAVPVAQTATLPGIQGTAIDVGLGSNTAREFPPCDYDEVLLKCAQVDNLYNTGGISEPHWYAGLALARHMSDPEDAAISMSEAHKDYTEAATMAKLYSSTKDRTGPTTCKRFQEFGPKGLCESCPKYGKITTPAQLGQPTPPPAKVVFRRTEGTEVAPVIELNMPFSYYIELSDGGVTVMQESKDGKPTVVHVGNIFPIDRLEDTRTGDSHITWTLTAPRKSDFNVVIPQAIMADPKALDTLLNSKGVTVRNITKLKAFMSAYIHQLQKATKPRKLIGQLGWNTTHTSFTLAPVEYHTDGSSEIHEVAESFLEAMPGVVKKGTLEGWVDGMRFYNSPGHEAHQLMICGAFGSPLYHMTGHRGALVFASGESGTGKTTVLKAMNSIWGHPQDLLLNGTKSGMTANARTTKFGMYRNISMCMDEITNWTGPQFSALALEISQGEGKSRASQNGSLSKVLADWAFIGFGSSNSDAYDMIQSAKGAAGAESMRVFQLHMTLPTSHTKEDANLYANITQSQNYGHAGHVFIRYVVQHYDDIQTQIHDTIDFLTARLGSETQERFWISILATSFVAGNIAAKLGLIDFDVSKCVQWGGSQLKATRNRVKSGVRSPEDVLSEFMDKYSRETLRLDDLHLAKTANSNANLWDEGLPTGSLYIRVESYTNQHHKAWITKSLMKDYCRDCGLNFTEIESALSATGVVTNTRLKKYLGKGTRLEAGQVPCWEVDMTKL